MRIVWSPLAIEQAYEAARFIAQDKPDAALAWLDGLFESTDRLAQFHLSGRVVPEIGSSEFRELVYRHAYRVIYRVEKSKVSILTVRNFAQKLDTTDFTSTAE